MKFRFLITCGALAFLPACITSSREEALRTDMKNLELKIVDLQNQQTSRNSKVVQGTKSEMDEMRRQFSLIQGAIDELRVKTSRLQEGTGKRIQEDTSSGKVSEVEDRMAELEKRLIRVELALSTKEKSTSIKAAPKGKYKTAADLQKAINGLLANKDYKGIVNTTSAVIEAKYANDFQEVALYARGDAHFSTQKWEDAAADLTDYLQRFNRNDKRPRALLLAGDSLVYLKRFDNAKNYYSECVKKFPEREECKASQERLEKLGV